MMHHLMLLMILLGTSLYAGVGPSRPASSDDGASGGGSPSRSTSAQNTAHDKYLGWQTVERPCLTPEESSDILAALEVGLICGRGGEESQVIELTLLEKAEEFLKWQSPGTAAIQYLRYVTLLKKFMPKDSSAPSATFRALRRVVIEAFADRLATGSQLFGGDAVCQEVFDGLAYGTQQEIIDAFYVHKKYGPPRFFIRYVKRGYSLYDYQSDPEFKAPAVDCCSLADCLKGVGEDFFGLILQAGEVDLVTLVNDCTGPLYAKCVCLVIGQQMSIRHARKNATPLDVLRLFYTTKQTYHVRQFSFPARFFPNKPFGYLKCCHDSSFFRYRDDGQLHDVV
jgi:hypothetical protein